MMSNQKIVIIDYGMGNIGSIENMLKYLGVQPIISSDKKIIEKADKLILPGVGHFKSAMDNINRIDIRDTLNYKVLEKKTPILGICLGMQLLCEFSEEGSVPGLSFIEANVVRFNFPNNDNLKVPHMGWNYVDVIKTNSRLITNKDVNSKFYFVHSYFVRCKNDLDILTTSSYGNTFDSSFEKDNIFGVQFHPEKSHKYGINLFNNFIAID